MSSKSNGSLRRPIDCHWQEVERNPEQVEEGDGDEGRVRVEHVALYQEMVKLQIKCACKRSGKYQFA